MGANDTYDFSYCRDIKMWIKVEAKCARLAVKGSQTFGGDGELVADTQMWKQICVCMTLVFSIRFLYFYRQRLALTSLLLNKGLLQPLMGLERKVRTERKTCVPAWASRCATCFTSIMLFKPHRNPQNKHPHHPCFYRWRDRGPENSPNFWRLNGWWVEKLGPAW